MTPRPPNSRKLKRSSAKKQKPDSEVLSQLITLIKPWLYPLIIPTAPPKSSPNRSAKFFEPRIRWLDVSATKMLPSMPWRYPRWHVSHISMVIPTFYGVNQQNLGKVVSPIHQALVILGSPNHSTKCLWLDPYQFTSKGHTLIMAIPKLEINPFRGTSLSIMARSASWNQESSVERSIGFWKRWLFFVGNGNIPPLSFDSKKK